MIFECGHQKYSGKGKLCMDCEKLPQEERARVLTNIRLNKTRKKPKAVMGRPVTKTTEEKKETARLWAIKNRATRNASAKTKARLKNGVVKGRFVVEFEGKFKRRSSDAPSNKRFDKFEVAHTYTSLGKATNATKAGGKGVVMARMGTEALTLSNYKANGLGGLSGGLK